MENDHFISDKAYDRLFERLKTLEDEFDLIEDTSPAQRVGGEPIDELETIEHVREMLSLDSSEEAGKVRNFDQNIREKSGLTAYILHDTPKALAGTKQGFTGLKT